MTVSAAPPAPSYSFRDPAGALIRLGGRVLRAVDPAFCADLEEFLETRTAREAADSGSLVLSRRLTRAEKEAAHLEHDHVFEHEPVWFPSYPYEWPAEMLHAAGVLTLDLAASALSEGFCLKDATPYNVLFRGPRPVFVDLLSFEKRDPRNPVWMAYAQFTRTFLLPLLAGRALSRPAHNTLAAHPDGLDPEIVSRWAGIRRFTPGFFGLVTLPKWLGSWGDPGDARYQPKAARSQDQARYILDGLLSSCRKKLNALAPLPIADSPWSGYLHHKALYSPQQLAQKLAFVQAALATTRPSRVLDAGANEGEFSLLAARAGASVVAIDNDAAVVGSLWRKASHEQLDVLPLVIDFARPTPASGWRNRERDSFLDRARGKFDLVMMLALLHHLLVTERLPLDDVLALASEISTDYVLVEFVGPEDPMFRRLLRGRDTLYSHLTRERFEASARRRFELARSAQIQGLNRWLYLLRRR
jgi:SAM-dependent methyltransferase